MTVKIQVIENDTNIPIGHALVELIGKEKDITKSGYTNNSGWIEFSNIEDGKYIVKIRHADYRPFTRTRYLSRNSMLEIKLDKGYP